VVWTTGGHGYVLCVAEGGAAVLTASAHAECSQEAVVLGYIPRATHFNAGDPESVHYQANEPERPATGNNEADAYRLAMQSAMRSAGDVAWLSELVKSAHYQSPGPPAEGREAYYFSNGVMMYVDDIVQCSDYTSDLSPTAPPYTKPATEGKDEENDDIGENEPGDSEDTDEESAEWRRWWVRTALDHRWFSLKNLCQQREPLTGCLPIRVD
jgi:hypothetical protein